TASGGQITCLSPMGLESGFTLTQSVTIDCATSLSFGVFTINGNGIVVKLRNITFNGIGASGPNIAFGINATNLAALFVEHCHILGYAQNTPGIGIMFAPGNGLAKLYVTDSVITGNAFNSGGAGILIQPTGSGSAQVVIERTRVENNLHGIVADGTSGI